VLDDFEQENTLWIAQAAGQTELLSGGYESKYQMHVNHGNLYENNVQAELTVRYPFDLSSFNTATLNFWTYVMEKDRIYFLFRLLQILKCGRQWTR